MLVNAGYISRNLTMAMDSGGCMCPVIECIIHGTKFGIRIENIRRVINSNHAAPIEKMRPSYTPRLEIAVGYAVISKKGRAVNLFIEEWGCFTVSLASLRSILSGSKSYARIAEISDMPVVPSHAQDWHAQTQIVTLA